MADVEDVAQGIIAALDHGGVGERYILGGENLSIRQLASLTLELLDLRKKVFRVPNTLVRSIARFGRWFGIPLPFNPEVIPYATLYWFMDSRKAQRELGLHFRSATETLAHTLNWCRQVGYI